MESRKTEHKERLTLGSLFDGSGGFPLAGILAGVEPAVPVREPALEAVGALRQRGS